MSLSCGKNNTPYLTFFRFMAVPGFAQEAAKRLAGVVKIPAMFDIDCVHCQASLLQVYGSHVQVLLTVGIYCQYFPLQFEAHSLSRIRCLLEAYRRPLFNFLREFVLTVCLTAYFFSLQVRISANDIDWLSGNGFSAKVFHIGRSVHVHMVTSESLLWLIILLAFLDHLYAAALLPTCRSSVTAPSLMTSIDQVYTMNRKWDGEDISQDFIKKRW